MRRWSFAIVLAAASFSASGALAQESAPASRAELAARLMALLDSDDFATREQATRDLVALGDAGREALTAARDGGSLERRMRIAQILQNLGARASSRPARREPSRVTVTADDSRLADVVADIAAQSRTKIRIKDAPETRVTMAVKDAPLLEALDLLCAKAGCRNGFDPRQRDLVVERTTEAPIPTAYAGPMRVALVMMVMNRQLRFGGKPTGSASLQVRVDYEERAQALGVALPVKVGLAVDDKKRSLKAADGTPSYQSYVGRFDARRQVIAFVPLEIPEPDAKTIARLEFTLSALLPTGLWEAEIQNPEMASESGADGFLVTIQGWKETAERRLEVQLLVTRPHVSVTGMIQGGSTLVDDTVTFVGPDGVTIVPDAPQLVPSQTSFTYAASFPAGAAIAAVRVACLKSYEIVDFPVVFENVSIP